MKDKEELTLEQKVKECRKVKFCTHCKKQQEFYNKSIWCKSCSKEKSKIWYHKNKQRAKESNNKWVLAHPEKVAAMKRKYREANKDKEREYRKLRRSKYPEREKERKHLWALNNPDKVRAMGKRAITKQRVTPKGVLNHRISTSIRETLKGRKNGKKWQELVGYTTEELRSHLEKKFLPEMTWERFMSGEIHIDHKIPIAIFNYKTPNDSDFKRCWSLKNLQPMWALDNILKSKKFDQPFQPSLAFGE